MSTAPANSSRTAAKSASRAAGQLLLRVTGIGTLRTFHEDSVRELLAQLLRRIELLVRRHLEELRLCLGIQFLRPRDQQLAGFGSIDQPDRIGFLEGEVHE